MPETEQRAPRRGNLRGFGLWTLAGIALGVLGSIVVLRIINRDPTPRLTPAEYYAARERWKAAPPADYDIEIEVAGPQAAVYRVEVRGGQPTAAWRNNKPLTQRRTFGTWSIPGMFSTMARDVDVVERRAAGRAKPGEIELILKAQFDPQYHFPRRYQRIEWGSRRGSDAVTVTWEVKEFRVIGSSGDDSGESRKREREESTKVGQSCPGHFATFSIAHLTPLRPSSFLPFSCFRDLCSDQTIHFAHGLKIGK